MEDCISQTVFSCICYHIRRNASSDSEVIKNVKMQGMLFWNTQTRTKFCFNIWALVALWHHVIDYPKWLLCFVIGILLILWNWHWGTSAKKQWALIRWHSAINTSPDIWASLWPHSLHLCLLLVTVPSLLWVGFSASTLLYHPFSIQPTHHLSILVNISAHDNPCRNVSKGSNPITKAVVWKCMCSWVADANWSSKIAVRFSNQHVVKFWE